MKRQIQGVTLIELVIVIALLCITFSMINPLSTLIAKQQLRSTHSELILSVNYARNLALSTGRPVTICALHGANKCQSPWYGNLTIFIDPDRALAVNESAEIRKVMQIPAAVQVEWRGMNPNHSIRFAPTGQTFVSNGTFTLTHSASEQSKKIIINKQGRARTE